MEKPYVLPRDTTCKKIERKWKLKNRNLENHNNIKSKIQCFLKENICFTMRDKSKHIEK